MRVRRKQELRWMREISYREEFEEVKRVMREMERQLAAVMLGAAQNVAQGAGTGPATDLGQKRCRTCLCELQVPAVALLLLLSPLAPP